MFYSDLTKMEMMRNWYMREPRNLESSTVEAKEIVPVGTDPGWPFHSNYKLTKQTEISGRRYYEKYWYRKPKMHERGGERRRKEQL